MLNLGAGKNSLGAKKIYHDLDCGNDMRISTANHEALVTKN